MRWGFPLVLVLLTDLLGLAPLAYANPPDPIWISGLYDAGDLDDAVVEATAADVSVDVPPPIAVGLVPTPEPVQPAEASGSSVAAVPAFQTRAPPVA